MHLLYTNSLSGAQTLHSSRQRYPHKYFQGGAEHAPNVGDHQLLLNSNTFKETVLYAQEQSI